jgi:nucleotide-binding universal stress UspA family protein
MKILIAYDGSQGADDALNDLPRAGLPPLAEALIVSVAEVFAPPTGPAETAGPVQVPPAVHKAWAEAAQAIAAARVLALQARARVQALFPGWQVLAEASADSPAWGVIKQADTWHPDLIVVGSHGRSVFGRLVLGSVSQTIVTEARCSVRVARRHDRAGAVPVRLVIGVDGSSNAKAAVDAMAARMWPPGSAVYVVAVLDTRLSTALAPTSSPLEEWSGASPGETQTWVHHMVETLGQPLQAAGLAVSSDVKEGDPKRVLPDIAAQWEADCRVVGAQGLSRIQRFLLGSVSAAVATRAHCSVEIIRPLDRL